MQKVLRRTALAKEQAKRKAAARAGQNKSDEYKLRQQEKISIHRAIKTDIVAARTARREDWFLGPLAPRRDVGNAKELYGTINARRLRGPEKAEGEWKDWCIVAGDRVVVVEAGHRDRGRIGVVREVRHRAEECIVDKVNQVR